MRDLAVFPAVLLALLGGCAAPVSPEHAERQRVFDEAIAPCKKKYPSIRNIELDEFGRYHADVMGSAVDVEGFKRCVDAAMAEASEKRPFGMGRLADKAGPVKVAFTPAGRRVFVPVSINGVSANLLLDTGASVTAIRPSLAKRAGLVLPPRAPRMSVRVAGGERFSVPYAKAGIVSIGDAAVEGMDVGVSEELMRGMPPTIDGILGGNYLNHFRMTIDRGTRELLLEPAGVADPRRRLNRDSQL